MLETLPVSLKTFTAMLFELDRISASIIFGLHTICHTSDLIYHLQVARPELHLLLNSVKALAPIIFVAVLTISSL